MEDSAAMTVEFLRARLLSERSVSRSAKQRADELAKKVLELEEQLKIATMQRKKAEKATMEVLQILDNNGFCDFSESTDSNSDQEGVLHESKKDGNSVKEEENAKSSEHDASLSSGRSLSWKSCGHSLNHLEKKKYMELRKQHSFISTCDSSTKRLPGKSCRKIKRREAIEAQHNEVANGSKDTIDHEKDKTETLKDKSADSVLSIDEGYIDHQQRETNAGDDVDESQSNNAMERAVEDQGKLISQYEAEENAQREWEEKIQEKDNCSPESLGGQSNITEKRENSSGSVEPPSTISSQDERVELEGKDACPNKEALDKAASGDPLSTELGMGMEQPCSNSLDVEAQVTPSPSTISSHDESVELEGKDACPNKEALDKAASGDPLSTECYLGMGMEQPCSNNLDVEVQPDPGFSFQSQEISGSIVKCMEKQEQSDAVCGSSEYQSTKTFSLEDDGSQHSGESSTGIKNELQIEIWREKPNELSDVLEALQRAKSSLKHEIKRPALSTSSLYIVKMKETVPPETDSIETIKVPNYWSGLFRVPTDMEYKATTQVNFSPPDFEPKTNLNRNHPNVGVSLTDQNSISPNLEIGSRNYPPKPYFDPWIDAGFALPATSRFRYQFDTGSTPKMSSNNMVPQTFPSIRPELLMGDCPPIYSNFDRLNMQYRM